MSTAQQEIEISPVTQVDIDQLKVDGSNPNKLNPRKYNALKRSIQRYGFVVPIITNQDLLVADGEHRLKAAKDLGVKQVSVIQLNIADVDRRLIRQVMNKIRGTHNAVLDAEEYYRIICEDQKDNLKALLAENELHIENLLKLREPASYTDEDLKRLALGFESRVESNTIDQTPKTSGEPLTLKCHVEYTTKADTTERTLSVCEAFGLGIDETKHFMVYDNFCLDFYRGNLIYVTGDSGGGKSTLLRAFKGFFGEEAVEQSAIEVNPEETIVEGIGTTIEEAIQTLSLCGLNDAFLFLRKYKELSDGQKYRYKLAKMLDQKEKNVWIVDEFCACLDHITAKTVAYSIQKIARKLHKTLIVATTHDDLVDDFQPDVTVRKGFEGEVTIQRHHFEAKPCSLLSQIHIEEGNLDDYKKLKQFHYKSTGNKKKAQLQLKNCYKLLYGENVIGVIVYSNSYLNHHDHL